MENKFSKHKSGGSNVLLVFSLLNQCTEIDAYIYHSESASYKTVGIFVHEKNELFIYKLKNWDVKNTQEHKCLHATWSFQTGFFRTSMNALFGPMLRLDRLDSRRDLTTGRAAGPPQDPGPGWITRLVGASPAACSLNSSTSEASSEGREERLHVEGRGVLTSSRISSLDLGGLSDCPVSLPPVVSSGHRGSLSIVLMPGNLLSGSITERWQKTWELKLSATWAVWCSQKCSQKCSQQQNLSDFH